MVKVYAVFITVSLENERRSPLDLSSTSSSTVRDETNLVEFLFPNSDSIGRAEMPHSALDVDNAIVAAMGGRQFDQRWPPTTTSTTAAA